MTGMVKSHRISMWRSSWIVFLSFSLSSRWNMLCSKWRKCGKWKCYALHALAYCDAIQWNAHYCVDCFIVYKQYDRTFNRIPIKSKWIGCVFFLRNLVDREKNLPGSTNDQKKDSNSKKKKTAYTQIEKCNRLEVGKSDHFTRKCNEWLDMSFSSTFFSKSLPKFTVQSVEIKEISTHTHKMYHRILFMMFIWSQGL